MTPKYLTEMFTMSQNDNYALRSNERKLHLSKPNTNFLKGQWHRKFLLAISILLDDLTMKILSFRSQTF